MNSCLLGLCREETGEDGTKEVKDPLPDHFEEVKLLGLGGIAIIIVIVVVGLLGLGLGLNLGLGINCDSSLLVATNGTFLVLLTGSVAFNRLIGDPHEVVLFKVALVTARAGAITQCPKTFTVSAGLTNSP